MGNTNANQQRFNLIQEFYEPDWSIFKYDFSQQQVWTNKSTKEQYIATILPQDNINDKYLQLCYFRNQHQQCLYKVQRIVFQNQTNNKFLCYNNSKARVLLRPISRRLQEINKLTRKQGLETLRRSAKALNCLIPHFGVIYPLEYMILFTEENQPRFWVNRNLTSNDISQGLKLKMTQQSEIQQARKYSIVCVRQLVKIIEAKIPQKFPDWFHKGYSEQQTFFQLMNFVQENYNNQQQEQMLVKSETNRNKEKQHRLSFTSLLKTQENQHDNISRITKFNTPPLILRTPRFQSLSRSKSELKNDKSSHIVIHKEKIKSNVLYQTNSKPNQQITKPQIKIIFSKPSVKSVEIKSQKSPKKNLQFSRPQIASSANLVRMPPPLPPKNIQKVQTYPQRTIKSQMLNTQKNKRSSQQKTYVRFMKTQESSKPQQKKQQKTLYKTKEIVQKQIVTIEKQKKIINQQKIKTAIASEQNNPEFSTKNQQQEESKSQNKKKKVIQQKISAPSQNNEQKKILIFEQKQQKISVKSEELTVKEQVKNKHKKSSLQTSSTNFDINYKKEKQELLALKKKIIQQYISGDLKLVEIQKKFGNKLPLFNKPTNSEPPNANNFKQYNVFESRQNCKNLSKEISSIFQQFNSEYQ